MDRFCDELRHEREQRDISLETISGITKVSSRYLRSLEAGQYEDLPGGVFRKGILRGYLDALGIEATPWLQRFDVLLAETGSSLSPPPALDQFAENVRRSRREIAPRHTRLWAGVLLMILALAALCSFVWIFALRGHVIL